MISRRRFLAGTATGAVASTLVTASPQPIRKTFVLAHGTWHGGWVWRDVRNILEDFGHRVFTPTLTGCGERIHLTGPEVGLDTHIQDLINVLDYEQLEDIYLVGHSFTGLAITGVADRRKSKIKRIVYFDALVPRPGRLSGVPRDPETNALPDWWHTRQEKFVDGYQMDLWEEYPVEMLVPKHLTQHVERLRALITTHPAKTWTDELVLKHGGWEGLPRTFIHCVGQEYRMSSERMVAAARGPGWDFVELDVPRNGMMTHPELVANTLLNLS